MKPIKVLYSPLTERFYATRNYKIKGRVLEITGDKTDVTNDIAHAVITHGVEFKQVTSPTKCGAEC